MSDNLNCMGTDMRMAEVQKYEMLKRYYSYFENQRMDNKDVPCLDNCSLRTSKLQKLELELQKVHAAHEELTMSFTRMEKLEKNMRLKLEIDIGILREENNNLKAERDLQKNELEAQRLTIKEQRELINLLDNSLKASQRTVAELEGELYRLKSSERNSSQLANTVTSNRSSSLNLFTSASGSNSNCSSQENNANLITTDETNNSNNRSSIIRALLAERKNFSDHLIRK
ncbi:angiomotin-like protein 2 isoform X1 [Panonychus citri]|uniref:angiomotin-like protein 2 isoform X1 n=1 Tax=Panonychus citri TaxID=50023 RepID=UPI002307806B|nr:angiomotin-like protein 2 isoform X1 [Panonychus citri]